VEYGETAMMSSNALRLTGCRDCGTLQRVPLMAGFDVLSCSVCTSTLERRTGRSITAALACSSAALVLLIPANLLPFLTTSIIGVSRQSVIASSATAMFAQGYPELGIAVALLVVVLPLIRLSLLTAVLGALHLGHSSRWLGRGFRYANTLQLWAMADVFLLGFVIAYARLHATIAVEVGVGAMCFVAASLLSLLARATLDVGAVWRAIAPDRELPANLPAEATMLTCEGCDLLLPESREGSACPRCAARVHARKPDSLVRASALTLAAAILYVPANIYPMATLPIGFTSVKYTVLQGVIDLSQAKLFGLAMIVFMASFAIPLLKIAALAWCIASVLLRSNKHLVAKTRLYLAVEEIGRWSMVDPFVIACFVPVTQYNALIHGSAEAAAPVFAAVVILTTLAARCFDPRLLWDASVRTRKK
jgi:paraquat-inducible protein A